MADILKIKVNGEWQSVIAMQGKEGPAGKDYIITPQDKQDIADIVLSELVDGDGRDY